MSEKKYKRVNVEISNVCNLQCSFCPEVHRDKKIMDETLFKRVISQIAPLADEVCLHLMGEPMGHPKLEEFIAICAEYSMPVNFTSNGTLLNESRQAILLAPIVRQVNFSVHSFEANFGEQDVSAYLKKIFAFTRRAFEVRPDLYINYRIWDLKDAFSLTPTNAKIRKAMEQEYGFTLNPAEIDIRKRKGYKIKNRLYLNLDSRFTWPSLDQPLRSEKGFCHALSNHFGVHADGTVVPCCLDKEATLNLGNCSSQSIEEILAGERALKIENGFKKKVCVEDLCKRCDFIKRFDKKTARASVTG